MMDEEEKEKEKSPTAIGVGSRTIKIDRFHFR